MNENDCSHLYVVPKRQALLWANSLIFGKCSHDNDRQKPIISDALGNEESTSNFIFNSEFAFSSISSIRILLGILECYVKWKWIYSINASMRSSSEKSLKRQLKTSCSNFIFSMYFAKLTLFATHSPCSFKFLFQLRNKQFQLHLECINALSGVRRKFSWEMSHSVAYGSHLHLVCAVCDGHNLTSYSCFQTNVLATFFDIICIFFYTYSPYFMCHCTDYKLSALQIRISEENKLNATTQQLITAKISGCMLKQGRKTHSSLGQNNLQLQNETALMSCWIRAVEYRNCAAGLAGAPRRFARSNLAKLHKKCECALRKNTLNFLLCVDVQQTLSFPFSLLRHYQMPGYFYLNNCCFWARATVL